MEVGYRVRWFIACAQPYPQFTKKPPPAQILLALRVHPYPHQQHIMLLNYFIYIYNMEVGCSVRWFIASTMTLQHHRCSTVPSISQKATSTCTDVCIRVIPYPHPQQRNVLKYFIYIYNMDVGGRVRLQGVCQPSYAIDGHMEPSSLHYYFRC